MRTSASTCRRKFHPAMASASAFTTTTKPRCKWLPSDNALYTEYHDTEWGFPLVDSRALFEAITLESFQSGLSWLTILKKRPNFRRAFKNFIPEEVVKLDVEELMMDAGIVRHRGKISAAINNARVLVDNDNDNMGGESLAELIWKYEEEDDITITSAGQRKQSEMSVRLSKELKKMGWKFLGPTTAYAFMQSAGLVNDHEEACFVRAEVAAARAKLGETPWKK